ncbi:unnamed protein product [Ectocarpus sp. CCAP 1310/34]|nr:unnamed protein product [Ectocarpus sp. CCAP 1310/34]
MKSIKQRSFMCCQPGVVNHDKTFLPLASSKRINALFFDVSSPASFCKSVCTL